MYTVLEKGELNGVKLDGRTQDLLYAGLIQPNYPSISGKPTNLLGHLLEKYQWVEPRHDLIAEALYLLADPDGYRAKIKTMGETASAETIARHLKTEQSQRTASNGVVNDEENNQRQPGRTVSRPKKGFFAR